MRNFAAAAALVSASHIPASALHPGKLARFLTPSSRTLRPMSLKAWDGGEIPPAREGTGDDEAAARARLSASWSSSAPEAPPAADADAGAVDAGQSLLSALLDGANRLTIGVDVPFLDRNQPHLFDNSKAAAFSFQLARRVASHAASRDDDGGDGGAPATTAKQVAKQAAKRLTVVVFATERDAAQARAQWDQDECSRLGIRAVGLCLSDGRGVGGEEGMMMMDMETIGPRLQAAVEATAAAAASRTDDAGGGGQSATRQRKGIAGFVVVAPANAVEVVATRKCIALAEESQQAMRDEAGTEEEAVLAREGGGGGGGGGSCAVILLNPRFGSATPREFDTFRCAFGLSPFRIQATGSQQQQGDDVAPAYRPSVVVLKRWAKPWQLFVDADGSGHAFCGSFGDAPTRPETAAFLPAVVDHLRHTQQQQQKRQQRRQQRRELVQQQELELDRQEEGLGGGVGGGGSGGGEEFGRTLSSGADSVAGVPNSPSPPPLSSPPPPPPSSTQPPPAPQPLPPSLTPSPSTDSSSSTAPLEDDFPSSATPPSDTSATVSYLNRIFDLGVIDGVAEGVVEAGDKQGGGDGSGESATAAVAPPSNGLGSSDSSSDDDGDGSVVSESDSASAKKDGDTSRRGEAPPPPPPPLPVGDQLAGVDSVDFLNRLFDMPSAD